ncbi:MAG: response regulator [Eubacteriales bacterium]|nr:response regulator [Eubacteriales bacterium]
MSAIESGNIKVDHERFDFRGLITSLTTVFYSQAKAKGVAFDVIFDTLTEEWFVGDQMRTNQILTNLLSNAVKFTPEGGSVTLKIDQPEAKENASHIHFEVSDTGIGMTPDYLKHIWTPFEQEDSSISRRFGGTGLGLSITKNLVDLMGGSITVSSTHGVGTTFGVDLTFERTEQPSDDRAYDFSMVNALVVDDDVSTCDYVRMLFNRCGARCAAVTSGEDAIEVLKVAKEQGEHYSLCLVDWQMPQMDGIETVQKIKAIAKDEMPIIVFTAYDYTEIADKAVALGVNRFLSKPLFQSSLFDLLTSQCTKQAPREKDQNKKYDFAGARILLVEDNAMNMEIAKAILQSAGLIVDSAWNGKEAVEMFTSAPEKTYTAILMDVHMPIMNGHEATRAIRASSHPEAETMPIIAMTADAFAENVAEAYAVGMNAHISKPIDIAMLLETLHKYIN